MIEQNFELFIKKFRNTPFQHEEIIKIIYLFRAWDRLSKTENISKKFNIWIENSYSGEKLNQVFKELASEHYEA